MKKIIYDSYGNAGMLKLAEVDIPLANNQQLLIKVKAASINPLDWKIFNGEMKMMSGSKFPKSVGMDFSGIVEGTGRDVKNFKLGDEVFGILDVFKGGALADYLVATEKEVAIKPAAISFEQAAAMTGVGLSALQILNKLVKIEQGMELLINGASGGIGMFAIQFAKKRGAIVTSVISNNGTTEVKHWGSDAVINYKLTDVLQSRKQYDAVLDLSGKLPFKKAKKIMKPSSTYVTTIPGLGVIVDSILNNLFSKKKYKYLSLSPKADDLKILANEVSGGLDIVVSKTYPVAAFLEAYTELPKTGVVGKAVFTL